MVIRLDLFDITLVIRMDLLRRWNSEIGILNQAVLASLCSLVLRRQWSVDLLGLSAWCHNVFDCEAVEEADWEVEGRHSEVNVFLVCDQVVKGEQSACWENVGECDYDLDKWLGLAYWVLVDVVWKERNVQADYWAGREQDASDEKAGIKWSEARNKAKWHSGSCNPQDNSILSSNDIDDRTWAQFNHHDHSLRPAGYDAVFLADLTLWYIVIKRINQDRGNKGKDDPDASKSSEVDSHESDEVDGPNARIEDNATALLVVPLSRMDNLIVYLCFHLI